MFGCVGFSYSVAGIGSGSLCLMCLRLRRYCAPSSVAIMYLRGCAHTPTIDARSQHPVVGCCVLMRSPVERGVACAHAYRDSVHVCTVDLRVIDECVHD